MGKRGRPKKDSRTMKEDDTSDIETSDAKHDLPTKIPQSNSDFPTKNRKSKASQISNEPSNIESITPQESLLTIPEEWQNIPFDELREEGWKPRTQQKKDGKKYMSLRISWTGEDGKTLSKERAFGPYDPKKYALLRELLDPNNEEAEEEVFSRNDVSTDPEKFSQSERDAYGTIEASQISPDRLPNAQKYAVRGAKILQSGVGKQILIPDKFYYDTDMLEFYEYFRSKGYSGTIVEWIHECVRNYLIMRHYKVGIIFERGVNT